jgi:hypothetical protein
MTQAGNVRERPAVAGELCVCGRPAVVVFEGGQSGPTGWCGLANGGACGGLCRFCGARRHEGRCLSYTLRGPDRAGLLLVCTDCQYAWEPDLLDPTDQGEAMSTGCPLCGGWTWIGELTERSKGVLPRSSDTRDAPQRR